MKLGFLLLVFASVSEGFSVESGYEHHYVYNAESDFLGTQNITTTVRFHLSPLNSTFGKRMMQLEIDSIVQYSTDGMFANNPKKWDLSKHFLFRVLPHGIVSLAYFHPDDSEEAVMLKKALASTLSAHVQISKENEWNYTSTDMDHLGKLDHQYTGRKTTGGIVLHRYHRSLDTVERIHQKKIHIDNVGTIHRVDAEDNIIIENRIPDVPKRAPLPGEYIMKDLNEGDIGRIQARAKVNLKLISKRKKITESAIDYSALQSDNLVFKKMEVKVDFTKVSSLIEEALTCIRNFTDKSNANRTVCVNKLRTAMLQMKPDQLVAFADNILNRQCVENDNVCTDERYLIVDILSRHDEPLSQKLIIKHFCYENGNKKEDEEGLRRVFVHVSALRRPIASLISCIEDKCFGKHRENHGIKNMTKTVQRACLALGNLAKTISTYNVSFAEDLMEEIADWLHKQDYGVDYRRKRSQDDYNPLVHDDHRLSKMSLIHTLGNAGLKRSLPHIIHYMEPNSKHSAFRRAAIGATRLYDCHESAAALLNSIYNDEIVSVKQVALNRYLDHPQQMNLSDAEKNIILSKSYTYPVIARVRRGFLDFLNKPLVDFLIALPEVHWKKEIGGSAIGASFGLDFLNRIHLRIAPLQGFFRIDIHDRLFAEAHIGIINYKTYILLIEACYRGHIEYNLNLLKDFVFGAASDLMGEYDKLAQSIVSPVVKSAKDMSDVFHSSRKRSIGGMFGAITGAVESLPNDFDDLVDSSLKLVEDLSNVEGIPCLHKAKRLANRVQSFSEGIKSDALEFYHKVSDATTITVPYAEKEIVDSLNVVIEIQKKISDHPRQGFATIDRAKLRMKMAMSRLIEGKTALLEALSCDQGSAPDWVNSAEEISDIKSELKSLLHECLDARPPDLRSELLEFSSEDDNPLEQLKGNVAAIINNLENVEAKAFSFMKMVKDSTGDLKELKIKYHILEDVTKKVKSTIQTVFGTKFHNSFPAQRRICDSHCGCGTWPATTGSKYKHMPGIDMSLFRGWKIVMPVNGMVFKREKNDEILIRPAVADFKEYDIILANIIPSLPLNEAGTFMKAGIKIATPRGKDGCKDEYFHLAMRKRQEDEEGGCFYINPSSFVDNIDLKPEWKEECKEFTFKHIGVNDLGMVGKGFMDLIKDFAKRALDWVKTHVLDLVLKILPDSPILGKIGRIAKAFVGVISKAGDLANMFRNMDKNNFKDFQSTMESLSEISKGIGEIGGSLGGFLHEVGVSDKITDKFSKVASAAQSVGKIFDIVGDEFGESDEDQSVLETASNIIDATGQIAGEVGNVLSDMGVSNTITDAFGNVKKVANGVSDVMKTIDNFKSGENFLETTGNLAHTVADISKTTGHLLKDLGVSSDVTDVFDKIEMGAEDISGIVGSLSEFKHDFSGDSVVGNVANAADTFGKISGQIGSFLNKVGVSEENTKLFRQVEKGANGFAGFATSLKTATGTFNHLSGNTLADVSTISETVAGATSSLNTFLTGIGVSGDVTNIFGKIESSAKIVGDISNTINKTVLNVENMNTDFTKGDIFGGLSDIVHGIESGVNDMGDLFDELGFSSDVLNVVTKIKETTKHISGLAAVVESSFGSLSNMSKPGGLTGILTNSAVGVEQGTSIMDQMLKNPSDAFRHIVRSVQSIAEKSKSGHISLLHIKKPKSIKEGFKGITSVIGHMADTSDLLNVGKVFTKLDIGKRLTDILFSRKKLSIGKIKILTNGLMSSLSAIGVKGAKDFGILLTRTDINIENLNKFIRSADFTEMSQFGYLMERAGSASEHFKQIFGSFTVSNMKNLGLLLMTPDTKQANVFIQNLVQLQIHGQSAFYRIINDQSQFQGVKSFFSETGFNNVIHLSHLTEYFSDSDFVLMGRIFSTLNESCKIHITDVIKSMESKGLQMFGKVISKFSNDMKKNVTAFLAYVDNNIAVQIGDILSELPTVIGTFLEGTGLELLESLFWFVNDAYFQIQQKKLGDILLNIDITDIHSIDLLYHKLGTVAHSLNMLLQSKRKQELLTLGNMFIDIGILTKNKAFDLATVKHYLSSKIIELINETDNTEIEYLLSLLRRYSTRDSYALLLSETKDLNISKLIKHLGADGLYRLHRTMEIPIEFNNIISTLATFDILGKDVFGDMISNLVGTDVSVFGKTLMKINGKSVNDFQSLSSVILELRSSKFPRLLSCDIQNYEHILKYMSTKLDPNSFRIFKTTIREQKEILNEMRLSDITAYGKVLLSVRGLKNQFTRLLSLPSKHLKCVSFSMSKIGENLEDFRIILRETDDQDVKILSSLLFSVDQIGYKALVDNLKLNKTNQILTMNKSISIQYESIFTRIQPIRLSKFISALGPSGTYNFGRTIFSMNKSHVDDLYDVITQMEESRLTLALDFLSNLKHSTKQLVQTLLKDNELTTLHKHGKLLAELNVDGIREYIKVRILELLHPKLNQIAEHKVMQLTKKISNLFGNVAVSISQQIGTTLKNLGKFSAKFGNLLKTLSITTLRNVGTIFPHINSNTDIIAFLSKIQNSTLILGNYLYNQSPEDIKSALQHYVSTGLRGYQEMLQNEIDLEVKHLFGALQFDGLSELNLICNTLESKSLRMFGEILLHLKDSWKLMEIFSNLNKEEINATCNFMLTAKGNTLSELGDIITSLGQAGTEQLGDILENLDPSFGSMFEKTNVSDIDELTSKFSDITSVSTAITESFKGSPVLTQSPASGLLKEVDVGSISVEQWLDSVDDAADEIKSKKEKIENLVSFFSNTTGNIPINNIMSASFESLQDIASKYGISLEGDKSAILSNLFTISGKVCNNFKTGIVQGLGHICIPSDDCTGIQCKISIKFGVQTKTVNLSLLFHDEPMTFTMTFGDQILSQDLTEKYTNVSTLKMDLLNGFFSSVHGNIELTDDHTTITNLNIKACSTSLGSCIPTVHVFNRLHIQLMPVNSYTQDTLKSNHINRRRRKAKRRKLFSGFGGKKGLMSIFDIKKLPINKFMSRLSSRNLPIGNVMSSLNLVRGGLRDKLTMKVPGKTASMVPEFIKPKDKQDLGDDPEKYLDITIFSIGYTFGVGPIGIHLEFGAGGAIGMSIAVDVRSKSGVSKFTIAPWVSGQVYGGISIELGIASGGLKLIGYIMKTKFPYTTETYQSKSPVEIVEKLDLELIPIELQLRAWAKVFGATVFNKCLWKWACSPIKWNIFTKRRQGNRGIPPKFVFGSCDRKRRATNNGCKVIQITGRHPKDTAFHLEVYAEDDGSDLKQSYAVGTYPGGTDVVGWKTFKGTNVVSPINMVNGIPLHWTVRARNSENLETTAHCMLNTYDNTEPDGRIEASYPYTSHPHTLTGTIMILDDSPLIEHNVQALGYSPGPYGSEIVPWFKLDLQSSKFRKDLKTDLRYFSKKREGKLTAAPLKSSKTKDEIECATTCLQFGKKCVSFDFEFHTQTCNQHSVIEGPFALLRSSGTFHNFERLDVGFNSVLEYKNISLEHGAMYFINTVVTNTLGYKSVLSSRGTIVDFSPPQPGYLGLVILDIMKSDGCNAAITQICHDVTWQKNHRFIIDGKGAKTVFNGHHLAEDMLYTMSNNYISGNWIGFKDPESGIYGFTWAAGRKPCDTDVVEFVDPHASISSPKFWTYTGYEKGQKLKDGKYYVTVQALNNVVHGGSLVTTVCHSTPLIIDTTPPVFYHVPDIMFDEDFDILAVYYNVSDDGSGIKRIDFGLGKSKHDIEVRGYVRKNHMKRYDPFFVVENLDLKPGVPAWIRVRAVNNVDLFAAGHSPQPIMIDRSPPIVGVVEDGAILGKDLQYQHVTDKLCAQWIEFYDPESGIKEFLWGIGTKPGNDDISKYTSFSHHTKFGCAATSLEHNKTYYSTVIALNDALNSKKSNGSSNGILIDTTNPVPGFINDGFDLKSDLEFSSESATVRARWNNFTDPESGIANYHLKVFVNKNYKKSFNLGKNEVFEDHSMSLSHLDVVNFELDATNGAELKVTIPSNGFLIDHTPPIVKTISDSITLTGFQADDKTLYLKWEFEDPESQIKEYRYYINRLYGGQKEKLWSISSEYQVFYPPSSNQAKVNISLSMTSGEKVFAHVTAVNGADMSSSYESSGVIIDTTPPKLIKIHIGHIEEEEEEDDKGNIVHDSPSSITVSWVGRDFESGIEYVYIAIGTDARIESVMKWKRISGERPSILIDNIEFLPTALSNTTYVVSMKLQNKAGLMSNMFTSKHIYVQKANVPGVVYDGSNLLYDMDFQQDITSIGMSFIGFESEACNIVGYEWAIGYQPYFSDVLPYTDYGIVMRNNTFGHAQIHLTLYEGSTYFITVRARTGHNCREIYILSSSNGITIDNAPPFAILKEDNKTVEPGLFDDTIFQKNEGSIDLSWEVNDSSAVRNISTSLGHFRFSSDVWGSSERINAIPPGKITLSNGDTVFITINSTDSAGLKGTFFSPPITVDNTPPKIQNLFCTPVVSIAKPLVSCSWLTIEESESRLSHVEIAVSVNGSTDFEKLKFTTLPISEYKWTRNFHDRIINTNTKLFFVTVRATNVLEEKFSLDFEITVDRTPPTVGMLSIVTSMTPGMLFTEQRCQQPSSYLELSFDKVSDDESALEKVEIGIGTSPGSTDVKTFIWKPFDTYIFFGDISLPVGKEIYVTSNVYNDVGLYTSVTSNGIVVSPSPSLTVTDGYNQNTDQDYQHRTSMMGGQWKYSDPCGILHAEWAIEDINGNIVQNYTTIPGTSRRFFNDELLLTNGKTYFNKIRTIDMLQRVKVSRSDGISVRIQTPEPGFVRDGLDEDIDYQTSTSSLNANWDGFGRTDDKDPTQKIIKYLAAVGNDRRFSHTRNNIHSFVDVGLNTSYEFTNLNLTKKLVIYYITIRAISMAGSWQESTSDGIRAGYREGIIPGEINYNNFQSSTNSFQVYWTDFISDLGIRDYQIAVSSTKLISLNTTMTCPTFRQDFFTSFDVLKPVSYGLNTYVSLKNLTLKHGLLYFISVIAEDESGLCSVVTGESVLIDTTPPLSLHIQIGRFTDTSIIYVHDNKKLLLTWDLGKDSESPIDKYVLRLYSKKSCDSNMTMIIRRTEIKNETSHTFYQLNMESKKPYFVSIDTFNKAGLSTTTLSKPIFVDTSGPLPGSVKPGTDWHQPEPTQSSPSEIKSVLAIASSKQAYDCPQQKPMILKTFHPLKNANFSRECSRIDDKEIEILLRHDDTLQEIIKGGVQSPYLPLTEGKYSFTIQPLKGNMSIATIAFSSSLKMIPSFSNDGFACSNSTQTNNSKLDEKLGFENEYSIGISIFGYDNEDGRKVIFWGSDRYEIRKRETGIKILKDNVFDIQFTKQKGIERSTWDVMFLVNGEEIVTFNSLVVTEMMTIYAFVINENEYFPPVKDVFHPFYTVTKISHVLVPINNDQECRYGTAFYDGESKVKEIWIGVSNNINTTGNIREFYLYKSFCQPCLDYCQNVCNNTCSTDNQNMFEIIPIIVSNLSLSSASEANQGVVNKSINTNNGSQAFDSFVTPAYYVNVRVINHAGLETIISSAAITVDTTKPVFSKVICVDPDHSMTEPDIYQSSLSSIGAFWECDEDVGEIQFYEMSVGTTLSRNDIVSTTNVGLNSTYRIDHLDGKLSDNNTYFVTIYAHNSAKLVSRHYCNITVNIHAPDVSKTVVEPLFIRSAPTNAPPNVSYLTSGNKIGVKWEPNSNDIEYYEWQIGSYEGESDVFPRVKIGQKSSRAAAIVDGKIWLDNRNTKTTLAEYILKNWDNNSIAEAKRNAFFNMEPGKCMHIGLFAISKSHLPSQIPLDINCILRSKDKIVSFEKQSGHILKLEGMSFVSERNSVSKESILILKLNGSRGAITVGFLSASDMTAPYGSAAGSKYKPFIVDIRMTTTQTSRILTERIQKFSGVSFFLSPNGDAHITEWIDVTLKFNASDVDNESLPTLVAWDRENEIWRLVEENCAKDIVVDFHRHILKGKICLESIPSRSKRQAYTGIKITEPKQFALVVIKKKITNTPPVVVNKLLTTKEDNTLVFNIEWTDSENDNALFYMINGPSNGIANITLNGKVYYHPNTNFWGHDSITVSMIEECVSCSSLVQPHQTNISLDILVDNVNDGPLIFFGSSFNETFDAKIENKIQVKVEANRTGYFIGSFIAYDIDRNDTLTHQSFNNATSDMKFLLTETLSPRGFLSETIANYTEKATVVKSFDLYLELNSSAFGRVDFSLLVYDSVKWYSAAAWFEIYVLLNPCVHGTCNSTETFGISCDDTIRSMSFNEFICTCKAGYEGAWCEQEIDECRTHPCPLMYDCHDKLADYTCVINPAKLLAILVCFLLVSALLIFLYLKKRKAKEKMKVSDIWSFSNRSKNDSPSVDDNKEQHSNVQLMRTNSSHSCSQEFKSDRDSEKETCDDIDISNLKDITSRTSNVLPPHRKTKPNRLLNFDGKGNEYGEERKFDGYILPKIEI